MDALQNEDLKNQIIAFITRIRVDYKKYNYKMSNKTILQGYYIAKKQLDFLISLEDYKKKFLQIYQNYFVSKKEKSKTQTQKNDKVKVVSDKTKIKPFKNKRTRLETVSKPKQYKKTTASIPKLHVKKKTKKVDYSKSTKPNDFVWENTLKKMKLEVDLPTRRQIFDFSISYFFSGDVKKPRDFEKIRKIFLEKFGKKTTNVKVFKRIFLLSYKAYKLDLKNQSTVKPISEEELKKMDKTLVLSKIAKRGQIKDSMHYTLDNIRSIQRTKLLTKEQEQMYARMVREGKTEAERERGREKLIIANLRLIISIAKKYNHKGISLPDLIDEGLIGLNRAIDKFEPNKGFKFATYTTWWIRQAITRAISDQGRAVRIPVHLIEQIGKASKEERNMALRQGNDPRHEDLEKKVRAKYRINLPKLNEIKKTSADPIYFDKAIGDYNDSKFGDFLADETLQRPDEHVAEDFRNRLIDEMLQDVLDNEEREIIKRYYGFGKYNKNNNLTDIARKLNKKPERVKELYNSGINKLRRSKLGVNLGVKVE